MSAECSTCGTDLVYGEWPEMFCEVCRLRAENDRLRADIKNVIGVLEEGDADPFVRSAVDLLYAALTKETP